MNTEYIIIQAGGKGTRLGELTRNKPKAIVSVNNRPIIFHIFQKFPDKKFIIIGDYKFDVLEKYLQNFANVEYMLVHTEKEGNAAGIAQALKYIPEDEPFMLIWSDLILSEEFQLPDIEEECYIGLSGNFNCSWSFENNQMKKISSVEKGVAGCFIFDNKNRLAKVPEQGSFAKWLSESNIQLKALNMCGSSETGTLEALQKIDSGENRCRPYNYMEFSENKVIKTGLTKEGKTLIEREERWYEAVTKYGFTGIPEIYQLNPLTMGRIYGDNIFKAKLSDEQKKQTIDKLVHTLDELHNYEHVSMDFFGLQEDYYTKTVKRVQGIRDVIPFTNSEYITINGKKCKNIFFYTNELEENVHNNLFDAEFGPIHGDCTLTNTMIDKNGEIYYIDARGYFGKREIFGDVYYDWAKLYYSIAGCFDQFNIKNFIMNISDTDVSYQIASSGWEHLTDYFLSKIPDCNISKIQLIHSIIWISLASHCWEDYDSMCLAFYNGIYLWNEWMDKYSK